MHDDHNVSGGWSAIEHCRGIFAAAERIEGCLSQQSWSRKYSHARDFSELVDQHIHGDVSLDVLCARSIRIGRRGCGQQARLLRAGGCAHGYRRYGAVGLRVSQNAARCGVLDGAGPAGRDGWRGLI